MTPEQFSNEIRTAARTGDWINAERACRAQAWCLMGQAIARHFAALATRLRLVADRGKPGATPGIRGV